MKLTFSFIAFYVVGVGVGAFIIPEGNLWLSGGVGGVVGVVAAILPNIFNSGATNP